MNKIAAPCQQCFDALNAVLSRPDAHQALIAGWYFYRCPHLNCHVAITEDGDMHTAHCATVEHGEQINAGYVASAEYHRTRVAQLLADALKKKPRFPPC